MDEAKETASTRAVGPLAYLIFLLRGPLIVTIALVTLLLDFVIPGSMKEALRYALIDSAYWYQLAIIGVALFLVSAAVRFSGEAMVELVSPDLYDHSEVRRVAHLLPRLLALSLGVAVACPIIQLAMDPSTLQTDTTRLFQGAWAGIAARALHVESAGGELRLTQCFAVAVGISYILIAVFVALIARGPHTPAFRTREPPLVMRVGFALFPAILAGLFAVAVLGIWQNGVADRAVERYSTAFVGSLPNNSKPCGPLWQWVYGSVGVEQCDAATSGGERFISVESIDSDQKAQAHALRYDGYIRLLNTPDGPVVLPEVSPVYILALLLSLLGACYTARLATAVFLDVLFPALGKGSLFSRFIRYWLPPLASTGLGVAVAGKIFYLYPWAFSPVPNTPVLYGREPVVAWLIAATFILIGLLASIGSGTKYVGEGPWRESRSVGRRFAFAAQRLAALDPVWQWLIRIMVLLGIAIFVLFSNLHNVAIPQWFGPVAIILLWGGTAAAVISLLAYLGHMTRMPFLTILVVAAFTFAGFNINNNHDLRTVTRVDPVTQMSMSEMAPSVSLVDWLASRGDLNSYDRYPIFLVATEGGGIRAAYFTATVLAALQDRCPALAQHTFAISGVSGGSLGASVFAALTADNARNATHVDCDIFGVSKRRENVTKAQSALSADLLSPLLGATLFNDSLQRIIPVPIDQFDRARALEYAVEDAWHSATGNNRLANPATDLYNNKAVPNLFLNTTEAGTGQIYPYITLTVDGLGTPFRDQAQIDDSNLYCEGSPDDPLYASTCLRSPSKDSLEKSALQNGVTGFLRLSTAAIASARFPYLTPAANVEGSHYVDGGYFENSGTWLINGLLQNLVGQQLCLDPGQENKAGCARIQAGTQDPALLALARQKARNAVFVVVVIQSEPCTRLAIGARCEEDSVAAYDGWEELLSPVRALLSTRDKRAAYSFDSLGTTTALIEQMQAAARNRAWLKSDTDYDKNSAECSYSVCSVTLRFLNQRGTDIPLTWLLSAGARYHMDQAVKGMQTADVSMRDPVISTTSLKRDGKTDQVLGSYRRILCMLAATNNGTAQKCTDARDMAAR